MSAKMASQHTSATAQTRTVQSRTSNSSRDSGSGVEGPTRRRLQKAASNVGLAESQSNSSLSSKSSSGTRASQATRRRLSIRDQKAPSGPRPQENTVKRNVSTSFLHSVNSSFDSTNSSSNSRLSLGTSSIGNSTKYENNQTPPDGSEFLAPINFDDFHNSIMGEPSLSHFPLPGHGGAGYDNANTTMKSTNPTVRTTRSGSVRRQSEAVRLSGPTSTNSSMPPPSAPSGLRSRRQSNAQPPSANTASSRPRKSTGPGTVSLEGSSTAATQRRPSLSTRKPSNDGTSSLRTRQQNLEPNRSDDLKCSASARNLKAKSLQPPSREPQENLLTPSGASDRSSSTNAVRSPARSTVGRTTTPSSAKRVSMVPPHVTGLGARTISPTDARRMKRMSTAPQAPPIPNTPPTQLEPGPRPRSSAQSPSMIPRKSATPSSSRTTPDPNRKSYSSGISLSSNTSYNSVRNSSGSLQPRLSQSFSTSRLPTPKPRVENVTAPSEDDVPPVPAIPKAFEGPRAESSFAYRNSSLPLDVGRLSANFKRDSDSSVTPVANQDDPSGLSRMRNAKTPDAKIRSSASLGKKNLQPLKLPPLNLLPLGTPMAAKIEALKDRDGLQTENSYTSPPRKIVSKTPSTPLTASKATFFVSHDDEDPPPLPQERSSTSHFGLGSDSAGFRASSSSSAFGALDGSTENRTDSPYISSSLPKNGGDFDHVRHSQSNLQPKITGPRPQTQGSAFSTNVEALSQLSSPTDPENNSVSSSSSLRNKLNLARRRSISKAQTTSETEPNPAKYDNMPPPRLPASATWTNLSSAQTSSPTMKQAHVKSKRKSSVSSITNALTRNNSHGSEQSLTQDPSPSTDSGEGDSSHNRSNSSILSPVHKILSSAKSNPALRQRPDPNVDADDLAADEEMRRLGSKRKDFEIAAKELEELRRRASPKERVSPAQALRMANLNIFERGEIIDFKDIYFCGTQKAKKHIGDLKSQSANFGYDDERGDYNIVIGDHLAYRYEVLDVLGKGSFGQVVRCVDHKTGGLVAVKIIRNKKRFHQQALVEVNILQKLKEWDINRRHSVVNFTQSFYFRGHLCISTELLGMNLYEFIKAHDFRGFSLKLIRRFTKQLLSTLVLLHNKKVIHCDLKPENILLVHPMRSEIKVIDFGSSCFENEKVYTYIQSRFYRSPEVILGMSYGMPIDMWSLGCILAELYTGYPIFPGENEQEQLACIMEVFGPPEKHLIEKSTRKKLFFDSMGKPRLTVSSKGRRRRPSSKDLRQALKCDDEAFLDFVARCLRWDPARRLTPQDAMNHEFITGIKPTVRSRSQVYANSPVRRLNTVTGQSSVRPLPEPPGSTLKNGTVIRNKDVPNNSPIKPTVKRQSSTANGAQPSAATKRGSNNSLSGSALPRVATRSFSGKPDLAAAAAATSLKTR